MPMPMSEKHSSQLYVMNKLLLHAAFFFLWNIWSSIFGAQLMEPFTKMNWKAVNA